MDVMETVAVKALSPRMSELPENSIGRKLDRSNRLDRDAFWQPDQSTAEEICPRRPSIRMRLDVRSVHTWNVPMKVEDASIIFNRDHSLKAPMETRA